MAKSVANTFGLVGGGLKMIGQMVPPVDIAGAVVQCVGEATFDQVYNCTTGRFQGN